MDFSSLLCYLDDLLVFASSEEEALKGLEIVFSCLGTSNLKLVHAVWFLGHVLDAGGVSVDQDKGRVMASFQKADLMNVMVAEERRARSFLGMVTFYRHFKATLCSNSWSEEEE